MHYVYIIQSEKNGKYYIGETPDLEKRIIYHNSINLNTNSTKSGIPWKIVHKIICRSKQQAPHIEKHIKRMKSRKFIENLMKYPELNEKLLAKYL